MPRRTRTNNRTLIRITKVEPYLREFIVNTDEVIMGRFQLPLGESSRAYFPTEVKRHFKSSQLPNDGPNRKQMVAADEIKI